MTIVLVIIIFLAVGIGFLLFYLIRSGILSKKTASARNNLDKNKNIQAIKSGKAAVEKDPKNAEAHYFLGKALLADGRDEQALRELKSVSRLGVGGKNIPETEFRQTIAKLYVKFREPEEALKEYLLLIKKEPENAEYYYNAGTIFITRNRADLAENCFKKAIYLNPKDSRFYTELGMLLYQGKKLKEAGTTLDAALKIDPNNPIAQFYKGKVLKDSKEYTDSLPYFEKASRDQEYKIRALVETGSCYMSLKMIDKAIPELERAVKICENETDPDSLYALYFLGLCYEKKQDFATAVAQWEKIYAHKKNFRDVGEKLVQYQDYRQPGQV
jgi:tetratricopeptide (TPR) repeat protein